METQKQEIKQLCSKFMLTGMGAQLESMVTDAEKQGMGFMQFTLALLQSEVNHRQSKDEAKRLKVAGLPRSTDLSPV
jgi:DNA replication protein DnaC